MEEAKPKDDLERDLREGRLTRRSFIRALLDQGVDMADALTRANAIAPPKATGERVEMSEKPRQADNLEIALVGGKQLVYDRSRGSMHSLSAIALAVFERCTGENDERAIARLVQHAHDLDAAPEQDVHDCLVSLAAERLIR